VSSRLRHQLPLLATLLAWSLLATTLAPFVVAAWRAQDAAVTLGVICTTTIARDQQGVEPDGGAGHPGAVNHCPLCGQSFHAWLPTSQVSLPPYVGGETLTPRFLAAPRTQYAWAGAQSRGPPAQS
jgi:hypothetical protein